MDKVFADNSHLVNEFPREYLAALQKHRDDIIGTIRGRMRQVSLQLTAAIPMDSPCCSCKLTR